MIACVDCGTIVDGDECPNCDTCKGCGGYLSVCQCAAERKPRPDLLPAGALLEAGAAMAGRTDRDSEHKPGFLQIPAEKYRASLLRHVLAYLAGHGVDPESGLSALAHVISNAAILWEKDRLRNANTNAHAKRG